MNDLSQNTEPCSLNSFPNNLNNNKKSSKQEVSIEKTIEIISDLLSDICEDGNLSENDNINIKPFFSKKIPKITIKEYLTRLQKYCYLNTSTLLMVLIYIDRLCDRNNVQLNYYNIYKLILSALIISVKYNEDYFFTLKYYSEVGGIKPKELKNLEYEFLSLINFSLYIEPDLYSKYNDYILTALKDSSEEEPDISNVLYDNESLDIENDKIDEI